MILHGIQPGLTVKQMAMGGFLTMRRRYAPWHCDTVSH
ncbi:hypothetical protein [Klebsiella pneumoniae IS22]|nr:hypothetical protein [Klebsiella pneumoniae IS22]